LRSLRDLANRGVRSFGSIHDCVQCLPNDLDVVHRVIRDQFFKLYERDPQSAAGRVGLPKVLGEWHAWMELMNRVVKVADAKLLRSSFTSRFAPLVSQTLPPGLVAEIFALEPGKRAIIDLLIYALADEPRPEPADLVEARALPAVEDFAVDGEGWLDLRCVYESPYFFA
jgi:DNA-directed RNA polymerase